MWHADGSGRELSLKAVEVISSGRMCLIPLVKALTLGGGIEFLPKRRLKILSGSSQNEFWIRLYGTMWMSTTMRLIMDLERLMQRRH